jgi:hypothetical protein
MQSGSGSDPGTAPANPNPENTAAGSSPPQSKPEAFYYPLGEILTVMKTFHEDMSKLHNYLNQLVVQKDRDKNENNLPDPTQWSREDQEDLAALIRLTEMLSHNPFEGIDLPEKQWGPVTIEAAQKILQILASVPANKTFQEIEAAITEWIVTKSTFNRVSDNHDSPLQQYLSQFSTTKQNKLVNPTAVLLIPTQTITRYPVMLKELKKHLNSNDQKDPASYQLREKIIDSAFIFFTNMVVNLNNAKRKAEIQEDRGAQGTIEGISKAVSDAVEVVESLEISVEKIFQSLLSEITSAKAVPTPSIESVIKKLKNMQDDGTKKRPAVEDAMLLALVDYMDQLGENYSAKLTEVIGGKDKISKLRKQLAILKQSLTSSTIRQLLSEIEPSENKGSVSSLNNESRMFLQILATQGVMEHWKVEPRKLRKRGSAETLFTTPPVTPESSLSSSTASSTSSLITRSSSETSLQSSNPNLTPTHYTKKIIKETCYDRRKKFRPSIIRRVKKASQFC